MASGCECGSQLPAKIRQQGVWGMPMTITGHAAAERLEADLSLLRASYLDLVRDSLIGRLNEDPPLPASKVDRYYDNVREQGLDWPSTAPSMIGSKRMQNVRSECERVIKAGVPGDFMETGVWRGGSLHHDARCAQGLSGSRSPRDCRGYLCGLPASVRGHVRRCGI